MHYKTVMLLVLGIVCWAFPANASILITEILADPPSDSTGDANQDGTTSIYADEFVELFNAGKDSLDLSSWTLSDAISVRHLFSSGTVLDSREFLIIFGGGLPDLDGVLSQTASSGSLSLNNSGDTVSLRDQRGGLIDQVSYGSEASKDQSIARSSLSPDSGFELHTVLASNESAIFSPGSLPQNSTAVPEFFSLEYMLMGLWCVFLRKRLVI